MCMEFFLENMFYIFWIRRTALPFILPILKGMEVIYIKDMVGKKNENIYCEVCECNIRKEGWAKHLKTNKHIENTKGGEKIEKKKCRKCRCWRELNLYRGENLTCNICLGHRENWAKKNPEKVREMNKNYREGEMKDEIKEKKKVYNQIEIWCGICECNVRKCKWKRHERSVKHRMGNSNENLVGTGWVDEG